MCAALAKILNLSEIAHVTEVARTVLRERGYTRADVHLLQMQEDIMLAQLQREQCARQGTPDLILCDRSAVDPIIYAIMTSKDKQDAQERRNKLIQMDEFQKILPLYRQSLFILLEPVEEWIVDDGVRLLENQRECLETFQVTLQDLGIEYRLMGSKLKPISDRVGVVMKWAGVQV